MSQQEIVCKIYLLDGKFNEISYNDATTVSDAVQEVARSIKLSTHSGFGLFKYSNVHVRGNDEYIPLGENKKIRDILAEFKEKDKLIFKIKIFRVRDEAISDPVFLDLSFAQLQHDYRSGNYSSVSQGDIEKLSALLILAEIGFDANATSLPEWRGIHNRSKPHYTHRSYALLHQLMPNIQKSYLSMNNLTKEDAKQEFMSMLSKLPYANSLFFTVNKIVDPIELFKDSKERNILLGINKSGLHFFRMEHRQLLHSTELKDIEDVCSSSTQIMLEMRVTDQVYKFEFETKQAKEIYVALQTHIDDRSAATTTSPANCEEPQKTSNQLLLMVQELTSEVARYKEKWSAVEATCYSLQHQLADAQHQLIDANQKLKLADLSSSELRTNFEEQKRFANDLQERLREMTLVLLSQKEK